MLTKRTALKEWVKNIEPTKIEADTRKGVSENLSI
jgi:hypothetical protein